MAHKNKQKKPQLRLAQSGTSSLSPQATEEWLLVSFQMPNFVVGEGTPFRPMLLAWLDEEGLIVGTNAVHPDDVENSLADSFQEVTASSGFGEVRRPKCLFVADSLYKTAKSTLTNVVVERAPEGVAEEAAEHLLQSFAEYANEDDDDDKVGPQSFLNWGLDEKDVAAFFEAMADLHETQPWDLVPTSEDVIGVWLSAPYNKTFPVCVMGQGGETFGVLIFENEDESQHYLDAVEEENSEQLPYTLSLNFERGAELSDTLRKEIAEHGWRVTSPAGYPWALAYDPETGPRPASVEELKRGTLIAEALAVALQNVTRDEMEKAFESTLMGTHVELESIEGRAWVSVPFFRFPLSQPGVESLALETLQAFDDDPDPAHVLHVLQALEALKIGFSTSHEAKGVEIEWLHLFLGALYTATQKTLATTTAEDLQKTLFDVAPTLEWLELDDVQPLVEGLTRFFAYLKRTTAHSHAATCHQALRDVDLKALKSRWETDEISWAEHLKVPAFVLSDFIGKKLSRRAMFLAALLEEEAPLSAVKIVQRLADASLLKVVSLQKLVSNKAIRAAPFYEEDGRIVLDPYDDEVMNLSFELRAVLASKKVAEIAAPKLMPEPKIVVDDTVPVPLEDLAGVLSQGFSLSNVRRIMVILDAMKATSPSAAVPSPDVVNWMVRHEVATSELSAQQKEMRRRDRSVEVTLDDKWFVDENKHEGTLLKLRREVHERLARKKEWDAQHARVDEACARYAKERAQRRAEEEKKTRAVIAFAEQGETIIAAVVEKTRDVTMYGRGDKRSVCKLIESFDVVVGVDIVCFARRVGVSRAKVDLIELMPKQKTVTLGTGKAQKLSLPTLVEGVFEGVGYADCAPRLGKSDVIQRHLAHDQPEEACRELAKTAEAMFHLALYADLQRCMWVEDKTAKCCISVQANGGLDVKSLFQISEEAAENNTPISVSYGQPIAFKSSQARVLKLWVQKPESGRGYVYTMENGVSVDEERIMQVLEDKTLSELMPKAAQAKPTRPGAEEVSEFLPLAAAMRPGEEMACINITGPAGSGPLAGRRFTLKESYCTNVGCDCRCVYLRVVDVKTKKTAAHLEYAFEPPLDESPQYSLGASNSQGPHAQELLLAFQDLVKSSPRVRQHFIGHYEKMKGVVSGSLLKATQAEAGPSGFERQTPMRKEREPGRNDPCSCGSGKKYKKCCLRK